MTPDTERALKIVRPLAEELDVEIKATDKLLYIDGQAVRISCNSTYATLMEIIGWFFLKRYCPDFRAVDIDYQEQKDTIMRYWIDKDKLKKIGLEQEVQANDIW